ncbi:phosphatase PAP2 family protein [uncultured Aliiroseovarius sp.]|uniref:phosphatase PAP2 family protein n=1 Tax=uncultured Aliiroseovarius sp. TaxID=1658783 RepID=UPI0025926960|nr:phosphatase PAP2 family protein [uncultured Aliiroseovarius sp.]
MARHWGDNRLCLTVIAFLEGLFFLKLVWLNVRLLNHLTMMIPFPFQDEVLSSWDRYFGLNWLAYFEFVHERPMLIQILDGGYTSLTSLSIAALLGLILMARFDRARYFTETFFVTAVICIVFGATMPALAAVAHYIPNPAAYLNFDETPGVYHLEHFQTLRAEAGPIALHLNRLPGLVTFPSFHTAAGILLCAAYFRTFLFLPVLGYTVVMIASTPVFGGHYFVDIFAGAAVALVVAFVFARAPRKLASPQQTAVG